MLGETSDLGTFVHGVLIFFFLNNGIWLLVRFVPSLNSDHIAVYITTTTAPCSGCWEGKKIQSLQEGRLLQFCLLCLLISSKLRMSFSLSCTSLRKRGFLFNTGRSDPGKSRGLWSWLGKPQGKTGLHRHRYFFLSGIKVLASVRLRFPNSSTWSSQNSLQEAVKWPVEKRQTLGFVSDWDSSGPVCDLS